MALRPIWWWFWLGWFPLFWFFPTYIDAPIRHRRDDGTYTLSYQVGYAGVVAFLFFFVFLFVSLFASVDEVWSLLFYWIWIIALICIVFIWLGGLGLVSYFEVEHKQDKKPVEEVQVSVPEESKEEDNSNFKPMRMRSSRQMKSLNMQL